MENGGDNWIKVTADVSALLSELVKAGRIQPGQLIVFGVSTSEIMGERIGTAGAMEAAEAVFKGVMRVREQAGFYPAFQCCEHLNRALVVERDAMQRYGLTEVTAVPVRKAGGAMAAYAFRHLPSACLVERIEAHAGVDIGDTLIGMHLRPVAVPFRGGIRQIGAAHVTAAFTRPKLIGGARAVYDIQHAED